MRQKKWPVVLSLLAGAVIGGTGMWLVARAPEKEATFLPEESAESSAVSIAESLPKEETITPLFYPPGHLIVTETRLEYEDGDLWLTIPRLSLELPVLSDVDDDTLARGIGLFREAQLPQSLEVNSNTSIGGHRDVCNMEFYYIDTVEMGDPVYLTWQGKRFAFTVEEQFVTHDEDWSPILVRDYPCLTLMSCEPIGVSSHRIFTVARLVEVMALEP